MHKQERAGTASAVMNEEVHVRTFGALVSETFEKRQPKELVRNQKRRFIKRNRHSKNREHPEGRVRLVRGGGRGPTWSSFMGGRERKSGHLHQRRKLGVSLTCLWEMKGRFCFSSIVPGNKSIPGFLQTTEASHLQQQTEPRRPGNEVKPQKAFI